MWGMMVIMARLPRIAPNGIPVHIIQRGNNRQVCFVAEEDYIAYVDWLKEYAQKYGVDIHAWVLMTNHVHLLCTPQRDVILFYSDPIKYSLTLLNTIKYVISL